VLRAGYIEQVGAPLELYSNPDNKFVAGFIGSPGMNFVKGIARNGSVEVPALSGASIPTSVALPSDGSEVTVGLRPQNIVIDPAGGDMSVYITEQLGGVSFVYLDAPSGERLIVEARGAEILKTGQNTGIQFSPETAIFFDAKNELRLR